MDAQEYLRREQWSAFNAFTDHVLGEEVYWEGGRGARWLVRIPGRSEFYTEIISSSAALVVHGDIDLVRFAHYGDRQDAWSRLCWMAWCTDVGYYVAQKAAIGSGRGRRDDEYDERVAEHEIRERIRELGESWADGDAHYEKERSALQQALRYLDEGPDALRTFLYEHNIDDPPSYGRVTPVRVLYAHAALNRCASLLVEKHGPYGPPECRQ